MQGLYVVAVVEKKKSWGIFSIACFFRCTPGQLSSRAQFGAVFP